MVFILILSIIFCISWSFDLPFYLAEFANLSHSQCLSLVSNHKVNQTIYDSIICGEKLSDNLLKEGLQKIGLIHLFVVSGTHLLILHRLIKFLLKGLSPKNIENHHKEASLYSKGLKFLPSLLLLIYCAGCSFNPPVLRAFTYIHLSKLNKHFKLFWTPYFTTLISIMLLVCIFPDWVKTYSLLLSWAASLAINYSNSLFKKNNNIFYTSIFVYIFLFPILISFNFLSPLSIVVNALVTPILSILLIPLLFLGASLSSISFILDPVISEIIEGLSFISSTFEQTHHSFKIPKSALWIYLFILNLWPPIHRLNKRQGHAR